MKFLLLAILVSLTITGGFSTENNSWQERILNNLNTNKNLSEYHCNTWDLIEQGVKALFLKYDNGVNQNINQVNEHNENMKKFTEEAINQFNEQLKFQETKLLSDVSKFLEEGHNMVTNFTHQLDMFSDENSYDEKLRNQVSRLKEKFEQNLNKTQDKINDFEIKIHDMLEQFSDTHESILKEILDTLNLKIETVENKTENIMSNIQKIIEIKLLNTFNEINIQINHIPKDTECESRQIHKINSNVEKKLDSIFSALDRDLEKITLQLVPNTARTILGIKNMLIKSKFKFSVLDMKINLHLNNLEAFINITNYTNTIEINNIDKIIRSQTKHTTGEEEETEV